MKSTPNRLIREKSPYLLQHAHNPVDWYPWGEEAFARARHENRPIFLSIGYSTCHWCHVMEAESFEDPEMARLMNSLFISIKVDREERPDIDADYMTVCQMMTGRGGWPLTIIMTPEKIPFFAATYIPRDSRFGRTGMMELLPKIGEFWSQRRHEAMEIGAKILHALNIDEGGSASTLLGEEILAAAFNRLLEMFDEQHGGFGGAPKFPAPHNLTFLLRYSRRTGNARALAMVEATLRAMRQGGIYDHLGFGFHRYATDGQWLLPHFEKMLYDQALLAIAYIEAYQVTGQGEYRTTAEEILGYVLRDMTGPEGGVYSAEDADSEGKEGKFYLWTEDEIKRLLGGQELELVLLLYGIKKDGNFREEATGESTGQNILAVQKTLNDVARELDISQDEARALYDNARLRLFAARKERVHPLKDDKILADWNGLMIAALAKAAQVFQERTYAEAAARAADFILSSLSHQSGGLYHRFRDNEAGIPAFLDDYAFLIWGLLELYEATFNVAYLKAAIRLNDVLLERFWDEETGGFFLTPKDGERLLTRKKEVYDGATPSGNSVAMLNLLRLGRLTANTDLETKADQMSRFFSTRVLPAPTAHCYFLQAVDFALGPTHEVVIAGTLEDNESLNMISLIRRLFIPNKILLFRPGDEADPEIISLAPYAKALTCIDNKATAYVCQDYQCSLPITEADKLYGLLTAKKFFP